MTKHLFLGAIAALLIPLGSAPVLAGPIESACMRSGLEAANRALCGCIQNVADQTLRRTDQRRAAKFFRNPDMAHKVWISKSAADDAFWDRYKEFGRIAEANCAR